ncbi:MAG: degradosome polyphosphate kinase, partial [Cellulosimicrobium sp.]|nr:degradosome polyphosphate kinase [Cellulosimicrobium sp.]
DPDQVIELLDLLDVSMSERTASWHLDADGTWHRPESGPDGTPLVDLQASLVQRQRRRLVGRR